MAQARKIDEARDRISKKYATIIKSSNPRGYNKYKKNPNPKVEIVKKVTKTDVQMAYQELWKAKCIQLSKAQIYSRLFKEFMQIDVLEREVEEEVKEEIRRLE